MCGWPRPMSAAPPPRILSRNKPRLTEYAMERGRIRGRREAQRLAPPSPEMELLYALMEALDERTPSGRRKSGDLWYCAMERLAPVRREAAELAINKLFMVRRLNREEEAV